MALTSNINPTTIDNTYPVAGQDNNTQGFRDNFTNIKNNFVVAASEITNLQTALASTITFVPVPNNLRSNGTTGQLAIDSNYIYICIAQNTWVTIPNTSGIGVYGNVSAGNISVTNNQTIVGRLTTGNITAGNITLSNTIQFANLTTTQINTISSPKNGMTVYNYTTGNIQVYNGTKWANVQLT